MLITGFYLLSIIEIHILQGFDDNIDALFSIFLRNLTGNDQRQIFGRLTIVHTILHFPES